MPRKICGLGFDCASMMLQPGIDPGECLNYKTCGAATKLTPDEEIELIRVREIEAQERELRVRLWNQEWERIQETFRTTRRQAAIMMLMSRGCPQSPESLGVTAPLQAIAACVQQLHHHLNNLEGQYIAPGGCEVHHYSVKRPSGIYDYNKLTADEPIFEPSQKEQKVRVVHLSHDDDPRNLEARLGIERRNQLTRVRTLLASTVELLHSCANILSEDSSVEDNSLLRSGHSSLPQSDRSSFSSELNTSPENGDEILGIEENTTAPAESP
ncbi:hypothetical protein QUB80_22635 [Chlorogloeopsis sp. ULAP01]|uniref:hypothetical protein n=1 Tax=Chlorogloeopsis sp. ULAP01 TaxID=3056483 RepID=UPI0025AAAA61|nr:hypothetical protein [Chlorogloeopsis sp. ULAP01]MDM9383488.1 hypothetical protein [Chlorogloeopsis sp. ULAP01]